MNYPPLVYITLLDTCISRLRHMDGCHIPLLSSCCCIHDIVRHCTMNQLLVHLKFVRHILWLHLSPSLSGARAPTRALSLSSALWETCKNWLQRSSLELVNKHTFRDTSCIMKAEGPYFKKKVFISTKG
jgi:hypothetical protein